MKRVAQKAGYSFRLRLSFQRLQKQRLLASFFVFLQLGLTVPCFAQEKWNATFRTGANFHTKKLDRTVLQEKRKAGAYSTEIIAEGLRSGLYHYQVVFITEFNQVLSPTGNC